MTDCGNVQYIDSQHSPLTAEGSLPRWFVPGSFLWWGDFAWQPASLLKRVLPADPLRLMVEAQPNRSNSCWCLFHPCHVTTVHPDPPSQFPPLKHLPHIPQSRGQKPVMGLRVRGGLWSALTQSRNLMQIRHYLNLPKSAMAKSLQDSPGSIGQH